jgi:predicted acylesterase/phospholipase RssA
LKFGKLGLIFDGGAFRGAYSVGYAKAVESCGLKPFLSSLSVGALMAALYVQEDCKISFVEYVWKEDIEKNGPRTIFNKRRLTKDPYYGRICLDSSGIKRLIDEYIDCEKIVCNSETELEIAVFNELTRRREFFSTRDEKIRKNPRLLKKILLASTAIAEIFPTVLIEGVPYSDGELFSVERAIEKNCDKVFVFLNDPVDHSFKERSLHWRFAHAKHNLYDINVARAIELYGGKEAVFFREEKRVPTLYSDHFLKGDITKAIEKSFKTGQIILERLNTAV